ncbi:hypothetical protein [Flavobacterium sp.]|uniref:hypothetical protein n=1 Tax=Flavobacterium sp. TaxID=239 RepID=UPI00286E2CCF|nr:hypothetical protein [Flavobacterium sp.]
MKTKKNLIDFEINQLSRKESNTIFAGDPPKRNEVVTTQSTTDGGLVGDEEIIIIPVYGL